MDPMFLLGTFFGESWMNNMKKMDEWIWIGDPMPWNRMNGYEWEFDWEDYEDIIWSNDITNGDMSRYYQVVKGVSSGLMGENISQ